MKKSLTDIMDNAFDKPLSRRETTPIECMECGHKFKRVIARHTVNIRCPKCGGYDTEPV